MRSKITRLLIGLSMFIVVATLIYNLSDYNKSYQVAAFKWGPLSINDFNGDGIDEVIGTIGTAGLPIKYDLSNLGLKDLSVRDIRFADFNNDGLLDAISNVYSEPATPDGTYDKFIQLYWGVGGNKFELDTNFSKNKFTGFGETIVVADLNNNGLLDILIPQYKIAGSKNPYSRNLLLKNNGNKLFTEVAVDAGVTETLFSKQPEGGQALDINRDGFIDLYVGGSLLLNNGDFTFKDITKSVGLTGQLDEGAKFFDFDLDGDLDFIYNPAFYKPILFINKSLKFKGIKGDFFPNPGETFDSSFGLNLGDINHDGYEDLLLAGGKDSNGENLAPRLYVNKKGRSFKRQRLTTDGGGWSDLVSFGDLNNDGGIDLVVRYGGIKVFINDDLPDNYIKLTVLGNGHKNQHGRVVVAKLSRSKSKAMVIDGGSGYMSNQPYSLIIPNDDYREITFDIYCADKVIKFGAISGNIIKDCMQ